MLSAMTKSGLKIIGLHSIPVNSAGGKVAFPLKGTVIVSREPLQLEYNVWTERGEIDPIWHRNQDLDLDMASIVPAKVTTSQNGSK